MSEQWQPPVLMEDPAPYPQMTVERIPRISWRKLLIVWLAAVGVFVVINLVSIVYLQYTAVTKGHYIVRVKWDLLQNLEEPVDVLILGDSNGNQGVIPQLITEKTGRTALNLSTIVNWGVVDDVWMLYDYIERFGPPEVVIVVHVYHMLPHEVIDAGTLSESPLPYGFWENGAYDPQLDPQTEFDIGWRRLFPLYYRDITLGQTVQFATTFQWDRFVPPLIDEQGFMPVTDHQPERLDRMLTEFQNREPFEFAVSPANAQAAPLLSTLADQHGFDVVIFHGPMYDEVAELPIIQAHLPKVEAWWQENVASLSPRVRYVGELATMPRKYMVESAGHVTVEGARVYTQFIIDHVWGNEQEP